MITNKQLEIFGNIDNFFRGYTFKEIKEISKENSNSLLQRAINEFKKENLIMIKKYGNVSLININYDSPNVFDYLSIFYKEKEFDEIAKKDIEIIIKEISEKDPFSSIVIFGSYATGKNKKDSDIDIAVIVENDKKEIKMVFNGMIKKCLKEIHLEIFTKEEFVEMLKVDYENVGKEIARKHLPLYNLSIFYNLIKKGIENGFKG